MLWREGNKLFGNFMEEWEDLPGQLSWNIELVQSLSCQITYSEGFFVFAKHKSHSIEKPQHYMRHAYF